MKSAIETTHAWYAVAECAGNREAADAAIEALEVVESVGFTAHHSTSQHCPARLF